MTVTQSLQSVDVVDALMCVRQFARQFYIGQWYHDTNVEVDKATKQLQKMKSDRSKDPDDISNELEKTKEIQQISESRKSFLLAQINTKVGAFASFK